MSSPPAALRQVREVARTGGRPEADIRPHPGAEVGADPTDRGSLTLNGPLRSLLPEGVRPGSTVAVTGSTALTLALTAELAADGRWVAGLGWHRMGLLAAHELGVPWERLVLVTVPDDPRQWATTLSAAVEGFDVVVAGQRRQPVRPVDARRVRSRGRERGTVLIVVGGEAVPARPRARSVAAGHWWPEPVDMELRVTTGSWQGLGHGHGHLRARRVTVEVTGRGRLTRPRHLDLWLPAGDGGVQQVTPTTDSRSGGTGSASVQEEHPRNAGLVTGAAAS